MVYGYVKFSHLTVTFFSLFFFVFFFDIMEFLTTGALFLA